VSSSKPEHLIKYLSPEGALGVLGSSALRWSSPDCFEDPFELSSQIELGFDGESLLESTIKLSSSMIFAPDTPKGDSPLLNAIHRWREESRFDSAEEAHGVLRELLGKMVDYRISQVDSSMTQWQSYIRNARMCCFCAKPDNLIAWERFASNHTGAALRFDTGEYSAFKGARAVAYQTERPEFTCIREQLGAILHHRKDKIMERFCEHHFIKAPQHKVEQEWRCYRATEKIVPVDNIEPSSWVDDIHFEANDLTGVYFGLQASSDLKATIANLIKEKNTSRTQSFIKLLKQNPGLC